MRKTHGNPEPQVRIVDEGALHKYRTEIPNTVIRGLKSRGPSVYAKWLYVYLKSVIGDDGVCFRSTTTIATETGMSRGQVSAAKKELVTYHLVTVVRGKNPKRDADHIRIKDIWLANMQEFSVHNMNTEESEHEKALQLDALRSVHNTNTPSGSEIITSSSEFIIRTQSSPGELGVHQVNQRRSLEEDLFKKKEDPPVTSVTSPVGETRTPSQPKKSVRAKKSPKAPSAPRTHFAPNEFAVTDALQAWALETVPTVDLEYQHQLFMEHEFAKPHSDWVRAWKKWMLREQHEFAPARNGRASPQSLAQRRQALQEWASQEDDDD